MMFGWIAGSLAALMTPMQDATVETDVASETGPFFVFFGFDSSAVDGDGAEILASVADVIREDNGARVTLTGHTDKAGASDYNKRLSRRRVEAVRDALVANGVPADRITVGPDGEGEPLIDTADGVREAQNRRVEIHIE